VVVVTYLFSAYAGRVHLANVIGWFNVNDTGLDPQPV